MQVGAGIESGILYRLRRVWIEADPDLRGRLVSVYVLLAALNIGVWAAIFAAGTRFPILLGLAPVAFGLGLRHAVDPDHIAAIDSVTRRLIQDRQRPVAVGLFFSLGHSTIVFALSLIIAVSAVYVRHNLPGMAFVGGILGTSISGLFLLLMAALNLAVLAGLLRTWREVGRGAAYDEQTLNDLLSQRGLLARLFRPALSLVGKSWHMYLVGLLFGLGFDTATEVGILGMSATAGGNGMPVWLILLLPLLFVAGMSLVDTTDGVAMLGAYGWAFVRPLRKLYYNINITMMSVVIAVFIGGVELLQVVNSELPATNGAIGWVRELPLNNLGFVIIAVFMLSWVLSFALFKLRRIDRLEAALRAYSFGPQAPALAWALAGSDIQHRIIEGPESGRGSKFIKRRFSMHEHRVDRVHPESVVLDIGGEIGALILYTDHELKGQEVDISPLAEPDRRTHVEVLQREVNGITLFAAAYHGLPEGEYALWSQDGALLDRVSVSGGSVSKLDWRGRGKAGFFASAEPAPVSA